MYNIIHNIKRINIYNIIHNIKRINMYNIIHNIKRINIYNIIHNIKRINIYNIHILYISLVHWQCWLTCPVWSVSVCASLSLLSPAKVIGSPGTVPLTPNGPTPLSTLSGELPVMLEVTCFCCLRVRRLL